MAIPGGPSWKQRPLDARAFEIFKAGLKAENSGTGLPQVGSHPIDPFQSACLNFVSTPRDWEYLGLDDSDDPSPGFLGAASFLSILSMIPDGLRLGDLTSN